MILHVVIIQVQAKIYKLMNRKTAKAFSLIELSIVILIIGIIIAGVTQSSRLVKAMRLNSARTQTQSSPIASIKDLSLWLESTSENSFATGTTTFTNVEQPEENDAIGKWNDINPQSSIKNGATQETALNQPTFLASAINGLPALSFDGANSFFETGVSSTQSTYSVFMIIKTGSSINTKMLLGSKDNGGFFWYILGSGKSRVDVGGVGNMGDSTIEVEANNSYILNFIWSDSADSLKFRVNGVDAGSVSYGNSLSGSSTIRIGATPDGDAVAKWNGLIGEVVIFERSLKNEEIQSVEKYLSKKWGIKI